MQSLSHRYARLRALLVRAFCCALLLGGAGLAVLAKDCLAADSLEGKGKTPEASPHAGGFGLGSVMAWPGEVPPSAVDAKGRAVWLELDGQSFDASLYPELVRQLGSNVLPDWRGQYLRGLGANGALASAKSAEAGAIQPEQVANHAHSLESGPARASDNASGTIDATGERNVTTTETISYTVTQKANVSDIVTVYGGMTGTATANAPYRLFSSVISRLCDVRCNCFCMGTTVDACGRPGSWVSRTGGLTAVATLPAEIADTSASGSVLMAEATYTLRRPGAAATVDSYRLWCVPMVTTQVVTEQVTSSGSEAIDVSMDGLRVEAALPEGGSASMATGEAQTTADATAELRPASTAVRFFMRAVP